MCRCCCAGSARAARDRAGRRAAGSHAGGALRIAAGIAALAGRRAPLCAVPGCGRGARSERFHGRDICRSFPSGTFRAASRLSPDGRRLFVTNSWDDTVTVIDTNTASVIATWAAGYEPSSVVEDRAGKRLFVADRIGNNITVLDAATGAEQETLEAGRGASYLAMTADGSRLYATHVYPNPTPHRTPPKSEITVIDPQRAQVVDRIALPYIAGMFHVALSRDGRLGVVGQLHPKNLVPLAHVEHGWGFVDTLTVFGADVGKPVEVPLDELERYYARPFGIAIAPDKSRIYVSHGGSDCVSVIDVRRMLAYIHAHPEPFAEDLSASAHYVVARVPGGQESAGHRAEPRWRAPVRRESPRRHDQRHRHANAARDADHPARRSEDDHATAPRRADLLSRVCVSGAVRLRQLPHRLHLRRPAVGSGARWIRDATSSTTG